MKQLLSPKDLALAIGASESSLKRWADEGLVRVSRTAGGHRRIALQDAVAFIRRAGQPLIAPEVLGLGDVAAARRLTADAADPDGLLFDLMVEGRAAEARGLVLSRYLAGESVAQICDGPVRAAMHRIGTLWKHDPAGIFLEHRATDLCAHALHHLRALLPPPAAEPAPPSALGGALAGDPYVLPSLMAAIVLTSEGWNAQNLGPECPPAAFAIAAARLNPRLIWIAISPTMKLADAVAQIHQLAAMLEHGCERLVLGGRGAQMIPRDQLPACRVLTSMTDLAQLVRGGG